MESWKARAKLCIKCMRPLGNMGCRHVLANSASRGRCDIFASEGGAAERWGLEQVNRLLWGNILE